MRPLITFVICASGLMYVGVGTAALGWILCLVALAGGGYWLARARPWENARLGAGPAARPPSFSTGGGRAGGPGNGHRTGSGGSPPPPPPARGPARGAPAVRSLGV